MKLQDYIHYYIGCYGVLNSRDTQLVGATIGTCHFIDLDTNQYGDGELGDFKPILRRLKDMTEAEMIGLLQSTMPINMDDKPIDEEYGMEMFYCDNATIVDGDIAVGANYSCRCYEGQIAIKLCGTIVLFDEIGKDVTREDLMNAPKAFHFLLTKHFDLFGLIDAGLAIDAKTIKA